MPTRQYALGSLPPPPEHLQRPEIRSQAMGNTTTTAMAHVPPIPSLTFRQQALRLAYEDARRLAITHPGRIRDLHFTAWAHLPRQPIPSEGSSRGTGFGLPSPRKTLRLLESN